MILTSWSCQASCFVEYPNYFGVSNNFLMVLFILSLCPLYFLWSGNWVLEAWFDSDSTYFCRNASWLMWCALNWSTSGDRRSGFPVMSGQFDPLLKAVSAIFILCKETSLLPVWLVNNPWDDTLTHPILWQHPMVIPVWTSYYIGVWKMVIF